MNFGIIIQFWLILITIDEIIALSFNQPRFCPNATWNQLATNFADNNTVGRMPFGIFITTDNHIYVPNRDTKRIIMWSTMSKNPTKQIPVNSSDIWTIFVTDEKDIYFDYNSISTIGIHKLSSNLLNDIPIMETCSRCYNIFIDIRNDIYCSTGTHQVIKKSLNNSLDKIKIIAGIGIAGSAPNMLNHSSGIFVDTNFDLYVVDYGNNRVQLFRLGQSDGITMAGAGSSKPTIILNKPTEVILDGDKYLYIMDYGNKRVVGNGPYGFRCLVGCSQRGGATADRLSAPRQLRFDSFGNLFVVDNHNNRIQKFTLMTKSCIIYPTINQSNKSSNILLDNPVYSSISYNRPKLNPYTTWNPNAITFADSAVVGTLPLDIFIDTNNTIYAADLLNGRIQIWMNDHAKNPTNTIYTNPILPNSIFVTANGDIYTDNKNRPYQVHKWSMNTNSSTIVMHTDTACYGLFVDIKNTLYCSLRDTHKVVARSLRSSSNMLTIVAGTGCAGNTMNTLYNPNGIFVDENFDLYIADTINNRIQLFRSGVLNGVTIAGSGTIKVTFELRSPTDVTLDRDKNLFIVENRGPRIIVSGPQGFRCIIGCISSILYRPRSMAFDSYGNVYVVDGGNNRIQKFIRLNNTLIPSYNRPKFCSNATWNSNGIIIANSDVVGLEPSALYIDTNNTIYAINHDRKQIIVWLNNSIHSPLMLQTNLSLLKSIFVTSNGNIYVGTSHSVNRIIDSNIAMPIANISPSCYGLFVDISNCLYCAIDGQHQVLKKLLNDETSVMTVIAGNGSAGSAPNMLSHPNGIFVDINFDLYVADHDNHRIQLFRPGQSNGITVAGNISLAPTIVLVHPVNVILDGNKYLFIVESWNQRIIGSDENGFRCIVGCSPNQLDTPRTIAFDSSGNLFVVEVLNNRIQKFNLLTKLCETKTSSMITLIPSGSTFTSPLLFRRSQEFEIVSLINFNSNESFFFHFQWTIFNYSNAIRLDPKIVTNFTELCIPARTLDYGIYEIRFQISSLQINETESVYVRIIPSEIQPNLVQFGTSMITIGNEQDLHLDPGRYSIDPDELIFTRTNWIYKYDCRGCLSNHTELNVNQSFVIIPGGSLQSNRTYQFIVQMTNRLNSSRQAFGYVLVRVEGTLNATISISCLIPTLCSPKFDYQQINPTTQVSLFSICTGNCQRIENITWTVYSSVDSTVWNRFNQTNIYFFGMNTSKLTAMKTLFETNLQIKFWRFEVIYSFSIGRSLSALNFIINNRPNNGSCSIFPLIGNTSTSFEISCRNWFDENEIKDYSLYISEENLFIAYSSISTFHVRLPLGTHQLLTIHIRDRFDCFTEYNLSSVTVIRHDEDNQLLKFANQNSLAQILISILQELNRMNTENLDKISSYGIPVVSLSISSLTTQRFSSQIKPFNRSILIEFDKKLQISADHREYLIKFIVNLPITTLNSIKLQSTTLVQLTKTTNELTRITLTLASQKCSQLTFSLISMLNKITFEDLQFVAKELLQCASNILTAINGRLHQRIPKFSNEDSYSSYDDDEYLNLNHEIISKLTSALKIHLNVQQQKLILNTSQIFISLETQSTTIIEPIAPYSNSQSSSTTNVSRSISLSITNIYPIDFIISRDPNLILPPMIEYNITSTNSMGDEFFHFHSLDITNDHSISVHFELQVFNQTLAYLFIYRFDRLRKIHGSIVFCPWNLIQENIYTFYLDNQQTNKHRLLIFGLRELNSIEFNNYCLRSSIIDQPLKIKDRVNFTSNYALRIYASACFYLDENRLWKSNGLRVGPLTNRFQTHCFLTHI